MNGHFIIHHFSPKPQTQKHAYNFAQNGKKVSWAEMWSCLQLQAFVQFFLCNCFVCILERLPRVTVGNLKPATAQVIWIDFSGTQFCKLSIIIQTVEYLKKKKLTTCIITFCCTEWCFRHMKTFLNFFKWSQASKLPIHASTQTGAFLLEVFMLWYNQLHAQK